jgi:uncharacterized membrane protein
MIPVLHLPVKSLYGTSFNFLLLVYKKLYMEEIHKVIDYVALFLEIVGVLTILIGIGIATYRYAFKLHKEEERSNKQFRDELGRVILLGLEILVAADIIATVSADTTMNQVLTLGLIVLIRTFLSLSIEVEIDGKLPWKKNKS